VKGLSLRTTADETLYVSKIILSRLIAKPMRQHEACEYAVRNAVSIKKAITVFYWLRQRGFIQKSGQNYCSPYIMTDKGKLFYKMLIYDA